MSLTERERKEILKAAAEATRAEFAGAVATRTTMTQKDVLKLAKTDAERAALAKVLAEVGKATGSNSAKAKAIESIAGGVEALVKIASLVV